MKQGSKTYIERCEFSDQASAVNFYTLLSTAKVTEVWGGASTPYLNHTGIIPVDDMQYKRMVKCWAKTSSSGKMIQVNIRNVKLNKNKNEIVEAIKQFVRIDGERVDKVFSLLVKKTFED